VVYDTASGHVIGAQIVGPHATELIHVFSTAIRAKFSMDDLREVVFAHPTLSESIGQALSR
jgi:pyruvate/2-oxoglutarate dehydrogenase complex dihydrolipoamide dehydrogenase (E3) component